MRAVRILRETGQNVASLAWATERASERVHGWLGKDAVGEGEGLLISPCSAVHSLGMRFALDVAYLDRKGRIVKLGGTIKPGRFSFGPFWRVAFPWTCMALELPAGACAQLGLRKGERLIVEDRT